jgi:hypothetical protein
MSTGGEHGMAGSRGGYPAEAGDSGDATFLQEDLARESERANQAELYLGVLGTTLKRVRADLLVMEQRLTKVQKRVADAAARLRSLARALPEGSQIRLRLLSVSKDLDGEP